MPLYNLYCKCGYEQEAILKLDQETPPCPKYGEKMKKAMTCTSFKLKGRGWALDGYVKGDEK